MPRLEFGGATYKMAELHGQTVVYKIRPRRRLADERTDGRRRTLVKTDTMAD